MDDESLRFWSIPFVCLVAVMVIFSFSLDYKINTVLPNAEAERTAMTSMDCDEISQKNSQKHYWSSENRELGESMRASCVKLLTSEMTVPISVLSPYVEFCIPGGFAPVWKIIENNTHSFNHDTCIWNVK